jgi:hypothetical protein
MGTTICFVDYNVQLLTSILHLVQRRIQGREMAAPPIDIVKSFSYQYFIFVHGRIQRPGLQTPSNIDYFAAGGKLQTKKNHLLICLALAKIQCQKPGSATDLVCSLIHQHAYICVSSMKNIVYNDFLLNQ